MVQEPDHRMSESEIADLAGRIDGIVPHYDKSETGLGALASDLGLAPLDPASWPRRADGALRGVACTAPVGGVGRAWTVHHDLSGVVVPLARIGGDARAHAEEFRRVGLAVQSRLRSPDYFGTYANRRFGSAELWGTPYMRWRGKYTTVELRAGESGPELVSDYTDMWEEEYLDAMGRNPSGFIGSVFGDELMSAPTAKAGDLGEFTESLAALLSRLPAETLALGVTLTLGLYGTVTGVDGKPTSPFMFDIRSGDHLHLGYDAPPCVAPEALGAGAEALGWSPATPEALQSGTAPEHFDSPWHFDAGGPGAVRAREAAELIVRTAKAAGVKRVGDLGLGGEAERQGRAYYRFPGLRLKTV